MKMKEKTKKQIIIFLAVAYLLPFILGIFMGFGYSKGPASPYFPMPKCIILRQVLCWRH